MIKPSDCIKKYGMPNANAPYLELLHIPIECRIEHFPSKIYCNRDLKTPLLYVLRHLISTGTYKEIKTFDGCFNIRKMRKANSWSLHSWGIAIDINAFENQMYTEGKFSKEFIQCWKSAGFDWGGDWKTRKDPMHFQLKVI